MADYINGVRVAGSTDPDHQVSLFTRPAKILSRSYGGDTLTRTATHSEGGSQRSDSRHSTNTEPGCHSPSRLTIDYSSVKQYYDLDKSTPSQTIMFIEVSKQQAPKPQVQNHANVPHVLHTDTKPQAHALHREPDQGPHTDTGLDEDEQVPGHYKVLDYLILGSLDTVFNAQLLCHLNVEWLLDASSTDRNKRPSLRSSLPCLCKGNNKQHSRNEMHLSVDANTPPAAVVECFDEVNRFIGAARARQKLVLIFSDDGRNAAQALALQYIMLEHKVTYKHACAYIQQNRMTLAIAPNFHTALHMWEQQLADRHKNTPADRHNGNERPISAWK